MPNRRSLPLLILSRKLRVLFLYLIPWYKGVRRRSAMSSWIARRSVHVDFGHGLFQRTNPLIATFGCEGIVNRWVFRSLTRARTGERGRPLSEPCCQLLLYMIAAFNVIFSCAGISSFSTIRGSASVSHCWKEGRKEGRKYICAKRYHAPTTSMSNEGI